MLLATDLSDALHGMRQHHDHHRIIKQQRKTWKMEDKRSRRQRYSTPYSTATMDNSLLLPPDDSMLYASPVSFAPMPDHPVPVPDDYLSYGGTHLDPSGSYYPAPQSYLSHQNPYYNTAATNPSPANAHWAHPSQGHPFRTYHHHQHHHHHQPTYQDSLPSIPSSDLDPDFDIDPAFSPSPSPIPGQSQSQNQGPSRSASTSSNNKDLTLYGTPSPTHPGTWRCAYPNCTSPSLFRRGCDLRKHYNRHRKHLFCRHDGCPQANAQNPGAGFSSKKDRDRHEAKHNPGIVCEWASEGCTRVFSRVDNMKDHVRRIHMRVN
ncbi:hypothetical protein BDW62DRAFT_90793 [Aspergillus aurantiobrunneus]